MSSKIVDPEVTEEPVKEEVNESLEALAVEDEVKEEEIQAQEHELPKKFQGKSATEIAEAYDNLEKELGRKGQEIGGSSGDHEVIGVSTADGGVGDRQGLSSSPV
jgi:hypothetical protein